MTKYLLKFLSFSILYVSSSAIVNKAIPFYYANKQVNAKFEDYLKIQNQVNTIFYGNSQVNRHINPKEFDKGTNQLTSSFNMASDATPFLELSFLVENSLKKLQAENYVLIVYRSADIHKSNLYKPRTSYYHDLRRLLVSFNISKDNLTQMKYHLIAFTMNYSKSLLKIFEYKSSNELEFSAYLDRGFLAYDTEAKLRNDQIDTIANKQYFEAIIPQMQSNKYNSDIDFDTEEEIMLKEYQRLQNLSRELDKNLYFLFMPNDQNYKLFNLPNTIYMGDGDHFPEFYDADNYFNATHLNAKGAKEFSKRLAKLFIQTKVHN